MENEVLVVEGMHCAHCSKSIEDALGELAGITAVSADHEAGTVDVTYDPELVGLDAMKNVIEGLDFVVVA